MVVYFYSRLTLLVGNEEMVDDQLQYEHLFSISVLSPLFSNVENYLVVGRLPLNLSSKEKIKILRKSSPFTWIGGKHFWIRTKSNLEVCKKRGGL